MEKKVMKSRKTNHHSASQRCQAVLSLWTEKRKPAQICRELDINWQILSHWQDRAMEGMLQALQPRVNLDDGPGLSPRLEGLLEKRKVKVEKAALKRRVTSRLERIQAGSPATPKAEEKKERESTT